MKKFGLYIKSHSEAPDHEHDLEAKDRKEAVRLFTERINKASIPFDIDWDEEMVDKYVCEYCPECRDPLIITREQIAENKYKDMAECKGCGYQEG